MTGPKAPRSEDVRINFRTSETHLKVAFLALELLLDETPQIDKEAIARLDAHIRRFKFCEEKSKSKIQVGEVGKEEGDLFMGVVAVVVLVVAATFI